MSALKTDEKAAKTFLTVEERNQKPAPTGWLSAYWNVQWEMSVSML